ncbi:hypothetical protein DdX_20366 [Ditylenchus destructor]|uniref:Uncharacterized protein n=1 Tax=Ditylenchus destructor TaxID=166010 RepID=A0AAD4MIT6_9BILA|nr:hypothetical protein DdX_20366 [Ditylenchus destructor]
MGPDSEDGEIKEIHIASSDQRGQGDFDSEKIQISDLSQNSTALVENEPNMGLDRVSPMSDVGESPVTRVRRQAILRRIAARARIAGVAASARAIAAANRAQVFS